MSSENEDLIRRAYEAYTRGDLTDDDAPVQDVAGRGDRVMVVVRIPGLDTFRVRKADDRNYAALTVHDGRIVALGECADRGEAMAFALGRDRPKG